MQSRNNFFLSSSHHLWKSLNRCCCMHHVCVALVGWLALRRGRRKFVPVIKKFGTWISIQKILRKSQFSYLSKLSFAFLAFYFAFYFISLHLLLFVVWFLIFTCLCSFKIVMWQKYHRDRSIHTQREIACSNAWSYMHWF